MRRRLLAGAVVVVAGVGAAQAHAAYPGTNGRIAYQGYQNIGTINATGGDREPLIAQAAVNFTSPSYSPDGSRIAFSSTRDGGGDHEIFVMSSSGTAVAQLTNNATEDFDPTWSPDGTKIAFEADDPATERGQILVMNADGTNAGNLSPSGIFDDRTPAWSPDGTRIAYSRGTVGGDHNIFVVGSTGGTGAPLTSSGVDENNPDWSPDSTRIVFERSDTLVVMGADGSGQTPLPISGGGQRPVWAPNGARIAYDMNFELFSVNPDGSGVQQLTTGGTSTFLSQGASWQPIPIPPAPPGGGGTPPPVDADGDGFSPPADCDDSNPAINPGAKDKRGNKLNEDCKGGAAPFVVVKRKIGAISATYPAGYMTFQTMTIGTVAKGDRIALSCKGSGCTFKSKTVKVKKKARKLSIVKLVKGMKLRSGATFQLRITRAGAIGVVRTWVVRAPKIPKITDQCLRPGAKKPSRCPR